MSTYAVLGVVWALVGVPLVVGVLQERRPLPMEEFQRAMGALQTQGGGFSSAVAHRRIRRRRRVSTLTYAPGLALLVVGLVLSDSAVLAVGLALVNLGTVHRLVAVSVDRAAGRRPAAGPSVPSVAVGSPGAHPLEPRIDEPAGDAHAWGDGWQIVGPEPRRIDDLVLVDADRT
jgi:hypothetical protein